MKPSITLIALLCVFMNSCSEKLNINQAFVDGGQKEIVDHLVAEAEYHYDKGEYDDAKELIETAYGINANNEEVAVLRGFISLALADIETFALANKLIDIYDDSTTTTGSSTGEASETLDNFSSLIVDEADVTQNMVKKDTLDSGASINIPHPAPTARSNSRILKNINSAIAAICPFVNETAKVLEDGGDSRHSASVCPPYQGSKRLAGKSHFLWALAHLSEAIAFNKVIAPSIPLMEQEIGSLDQNLGIGQFVNKLSSALSFLNTIMPDQGEDAADAMITAIFNDLDATVKGFGEIPGIPKKITEKISGALDNLKAKKDELAEKRAAAAESQNINPNSDAIKNQLTDTLAQKIRDKLTPERIGQLQSDDTNRAKFCTEWKKLTADPVPQGITCS